MITYSLNKVIRRYMFITRFRRYKIGIRANLIVFIYYTKDIG